MQSANYSHSKAVALAFVSVSVTHDFEPFYAPIYVLYQNPQPCQLAVIRFFLRCQFLIFTFFYRRFAVCVKLNYALVATVGQYLDELVYAYEFVLKQLEIVSSPRRLRNANHFRSFAVYDDLRFDGVPLFLA